MGTSRFKSAGPIKGKGKASAKPGRNRAEAGHCIELATLGAGPFWSVEPAFKSLPGVLETAVGYAGGDMPHPTFLDVFCEQSGHAEVVQVRYDRNRITYTELLEVFWSCHDPTQLNRQGPDIGVQYRSVIFCHNGVQAMLARRSRDLKDQSSAFNRPIVTQIELLQRFWPAEPELQDYFDDADEAEACSPARTKISNPRAGS